MRRDYSDWDSLTKAVQEKAAAILEKKVAPIAKRIVHKHIREDIYGMYTPAGSAKGGYDRRAALADVRNIISSLIDGDCLLVTSIAKPSPSIFKEKYRSPYEPAESRLLQWIEGGHAPNYFNQKNYPWMKPRPAIENAQTEICRGREVSIAIEAALKNIGN